MFFCLISDHFYIMPGNLATLLRKIPSIPRTYYLEKFDPGENLSWTGVNRVGNEKVKQKSFVSEIWQIPLVKYFP